MSPVQPHNAHPDMAHADLLSMGDTATDQSATNSYSAKDAAKVKAIRAFLRDHGMTVREFAESKGLDRQDVADLLYLRNKGVRGKAHQAAVAIGLKPKPRRKSVEEYA